MDIRGHTIAKRNNRLPFVKVLSKIALNKYFFRNQKNTPAAVKF